MKPPKGFVLVKESRLNNLLAMNAKQLLNSPPPPPPSIGVSPIPIAETNVSHMQSVIQQIRSDIAGNASRAKELEPFLDKIGIYIESNPLLLERYIEGTLKVASGIHEASLIGSKGLPLGGTRELMAESAKQDTMGWLTKLGNDMQTDLKTIVEDGMRNKMSYQDIARNMEDKVDSLGRTRAERIARTESVRAVNDAKYEVASNDDYAGFYVISAEDCCPECADTYIGETFTMDDKDMLPPLHVNCRCSAVFFRTDKLVNQSSDRYVERRPEDATMPTEDRVNKVVPETVQSPSVDEMLNE